MGLEYTLIDCDLDVHFIPVLRKVVESYLFSETKQETYMISLHCQEAYFRSNFGTPVFSPKFYHALMSGIANHGYCLVRFLENGSWTKFKECIFDL